METIFQSGGFRVFLEFLLKSSLILGIALLASTWSRKRSASFRHALLASALLGVMLLPFLMAFAPGWQTGIIPSFLAAPNPNGPEPEKGLTRVSLALDIPKSGVAVNGITMAAWDAQPVAMSTPAHITAVNLSYPGTGASVFYLLAGLWAAGVAFMLIKLVTGLYGTARLSHQSEKVAGYPWMQLLQWFRDRTPLKRRVQLLKSSQVTVPATWGMIKPVVMLPEESNQWPLDQCSSVLFHELSHVKRRDFPIRFLARLSCSLYWFNPLCWMVFRRLKREQEKACDEMVLQSGVKASTYASHLLQMKKAADLGGPGQQPAAAIAMAGKSEFNERMHSILKKQLNLKEVKMKTKVSLLVITMLAVVLVGTAQPYDKTEIPDKPEKPAKVKVEAPALPAVPELPTVPEPATAPELPTVPEPATSPEPVSTPEPTAAPDPKTVPDAPAVPAPPEKEKKEEKKKVKKVKKEKVKLIVKAGKDGEHAVLYLTDAKDGKAVTVKDGKIFIDGKEVKGKKGEVIKLETGHLLIKSDEGKVKKIKFSPDSKGKKNVIRIVADKLAISHDELESGEATANVVALVKEDGKGDVYSIFLKGDKIKKGEGAVLVAPAGKGNWTLKKGMEVDGDVDIYIDDGDGHKKLGIYAKKKDGKITLRRKLDNGDTKIHVSFDRGLKAKGKLAEFKCTKKRKLSAGQKADLEKAFAGFKKKLPAGFVMGKPDMGDTVQSFTIETTKDGLEWPETKEVYVMLLKLHETVSDIISDVTEV